jgi:hypothetical protein
MKILKEKNSFSHITLVYNQKKKNLTRNYLAKKSRINFYNIKNPNDKKFLFKNFSKNHNISLFFKNKNYFIETIGYKNTKKPKKSLYRYIEKKNHIEIFSSSTDFKSDIEIFKLLLIIKKQKKNFTLKTKNNTEVRLYENFKKVKSTVFLEHEGINVLSFYIADIKKARSILVKNKIKVSKIFEVKLLKKNKIFFSRFPSGIIVEFLNY